MSIIILTLTTTVANESYYSLRISDDNIVLNMWRVANEMDHADVEDMFLRFLT